MQIAMHRGIVCALACPLLAAACSTLAHAQPVDPEETAARVVAQMTKAEQSFISHAGNIQFRPLGWDRGLANWRPEIRWRYKPTVPIGSKPPSPLIQRLIADAVCRQIPVSLRVMHRLDRLLEGRLFGPDEAAVATAIAHRQRLGLAFRSALSIVTSQQLKDINRRRRLKRLLAEKGPNQAIRLVRSFHRLCQEAATRR